MAKVKLSMIFDIDLPSGLQDKLDTMMKVDKGSSFFYMSNCKAFAKEHPETIPWLVRNGYIDCDILVQVKSDEKQEEVDITVAQHPVL